MTTLEDYHGQYRELEKLEDVIVTLEQILRVGYYNAYCRQSNAHMLLQNVIFG